MQQRYSALLEDYFEYNTRFIKVSLELISPYRIDFNAGQSISVIVNEEVQKNVYIFSSPDIDHGIELLLDTKGDRETIEFFKRLTLGDKIEFFAPFDGFEIDTTTELILIASNAGIAPMYSLVQDLLQVKGVTEKITLYWGLDSLDVFFLSEEMTQLTNNFSHFNFHPVLASALPEWTLCRGSVYDCLSVHEVNADAAFYLCAPEDQTRRIVDLCLNNGVDKQQLHIAKYY